MMENFVKNFAVNLDDKTDATAISNLLSLAKGEQLKVKSLIITGDMTVSRSLNVDGNSVITGNNTVRKDNIVNRNNSIAGNSVITGNNTVGKDNIVNGKLTVKNGSDFSGGNHIF